MNREKLRKHWPYMSRLERVDYETRIANELLRIARGHLIVVDQNLTGQANQSALFTEDDRSVVHDLLIDVDTLCGRAAKVADRLRLHPAEEAKV